MRLRLWLVAAVLLAAGSCVGRIRVEEPLCSGVIPQHLYPRCRLLASR